MAKAFISYHRLSIETAKQLATDLEAMGHEAWLDQELAGGESWWTRILAMVRGCDLFVLVLDTQSLDSTACGREFEYARDLGKPILPVLAGDGVSLNLLPSALAEIQFVDYRTNDRKAVLKLVQALSKLPSAPPLPDPLPPPPDVPVSFLNALTARVDRPSAMTYEDQSALLGDLRYALRDRTIRGDAVTLLRRLRRRRDLLASVAEDIDETLSGEANAAAAQPAPSIQPPATPPKTSPRAARVSHTEPAPAAKAGSKAPAIAASRSETRQFDPYAAATPRVGLRRRLTMAVIAGVVGGIAAVMAEAAGYYGSSEPLLTFAVGAVPWTIAGAIAALRPRAILYALAFAIPVFVVAWLIGEINDEDDALVLATVFGAGPALVLGAAVGVLRDRRLKRIASGVPS